MEEQFKPQEILVSEFSSVKSKSPRIISIEQFVANLTGQKHRAHVQEYRRLAATPGMEGKAKEKKERTPCIVPAGVCQGGHRVSDLVRYSGLLCIDLDHTDGRTDEIMTRLKQLPWVLLAFVSISGSGVKVFVRVSEKVVEQGYEPLYHAVGRMVSQAVNHPYDEKCKILTQPCYYSWHPEAYYNPQAVEIAISDERLVVSDKRLVVSDEQVAVGEEPKGFLLTFLDSFERRHPFVRGKRNDICMALGREASCKGFSKEELEDLMQTYIRHHAASDFTAADIRQRVTAGYQFVNKNKQEKQSENRVRIGSRVHFGPSYHVEGEVEEEDLLEINNNLRAETPCIPERVYQLLPDFLKQCVKHASDARERDLLLLASLNCCSAAFPHVSFLYRNVSNSPHFYLSVVAPAGSGKGVLSFAVSMLDGIQHHYDQLRVQQKKAHEAALLEWENEQQQARREKRKPDISLKPEEQKLPYFKISPTTSKNRFIESLAAASRTGCFMCSTEIVTLLSALGQDYGKFEDILLKSAHHEEVSSSFKVDREPIVVREPRLAILLSGTQEQFNALFRSLEVGLYSRFAVYTRPQSLSWESCEPNLDGVDLRNYYRNLGGELYQMHKTLLESPTLVSFTHQQWTKHTTFFSTRLTEYVAEGGDAVQGIIFRHGLLACRIASVLTVFRKCSQYPESKDYICTDEDFDVALQIVDTLLAHSLLLATALPATLRAPSPMHKVKQVPVIMEQLKEKFSYTEFLNVANEVGISRSAAKRMLNKCVKLQLIYKEEDSYRKPTEVEQQ